MSTLRISSPCLRTCGAFVCACGICVSTKVEPVCSRVSCLCPLARGACVCACWACVCACVEPVCACWACVCAFGACVRARAEPVCACGACMCACVRQPWPSSSEGQGSHPADTSSTPRPMVLRNCMSSIEGASLSSSFTLISRFRAQSRHDMATLFSKSRDRRRHVDFILEISDLSRQTISWYFTFILEIPRFKSTFRH